MFMTKRSISLTALMVGTVLAVSAPAMAEETIIAHGISSYGDLKYGPDYTHFDYVNVDAPQGGTLTMRPSTGGGTFDSFNNFILKPMSS